MGCEALSDRHRKHRREDENVELDDDAADVAGSGPTLVVMMGLSIEMPFEWTRNR